MLLFSGTLFAQDFTVSGTVTDAFNNEALAGVNVIVKGTSTGTITDIEGAYRLEVPAGSTTLVFSFVGYLSQEVAISSSQTTIDIQLEEDITNLEEVVVTGLASSIKRSNLANAVSTISAEELTGTTSPQTIGSAMYGKLTGVNMNTASGANGTAPSVQLRGISTVSNGNSEPLYIIDGVYVNNNAISNGMSTATGAGGGQSSRLQDDISTRIADLNPDDIESIEVLKGSSAAAIYGTRANAGVIIITTKRGKAGKTRVNLSQEVGYNQAVNLLDFADWDQTKIDTYFGGSAQRTADLASGRDNDWEDIIYGEEGLITNTSLTVSGGSDKTQFFINGSVRSEDGIIKNSGFSRNSIRANIDHQISPKIKISSSSNYVWTENDRSFNGNQNGTGASFGYNLSFTPPYADLLPDADGNYPNNPYFSENPLALRDKATNNAVVNRFVQAFNLDYSIWQSANSLLKLTFSGGLDFLNSSTLVHMPEDLQFQSNRVNPGDVFEGSSQQINTNMQAFLIYNTQVNDINLNTQIGAVKLTEDRESLIVRGQGLSNGQQNANTATIQSIFRQNKADISDVGLIAQQEANWADRIIATVGVRMDRSSLNLDESEFFVFPKASIAFNIANFDFFNVNQISQLKLRAAYGETGGLPNFGTTFTQLNNVFVGGSSGTTLSTTSVDPNLKPETAQEIEVGLDLGLFNGRVLLEATYYNKEVKDLINFLVPASSTGITQITINAGDLKNTGVELALSGSPVKTANVEWFSRVNYWSNETELTRWDVPASTNGGFGAGLGTYELAEGSSPTSIVGTPELTDGSGNGTGRFTPYGDAQPDYQMSFFNQISFLKNFDFTFVLHHSKGNDNINLSEFLWDLGGTAPDFDDFDLGFVDGSGNPVPNGPGRLAASGAGKFIQDASYWKLREIGLYYTLPESITNNAFKGFVEKVKLGVSGNHLFIWSDYRSYDPEVSQFTQDPTAASVEVTPFPSSRRVLFHLSVDF